MAKQKLPLVARISAGIQKAANGLTGFMRGVVISTQKKAYTVQESTGLLQGQNPVQASKQNTWI